MATTPSGKKTGLIIGGIVVLALAAYGGMHYIESKVVSEVRTFIASLPAENKAQVGDVRYSLLDSTLTLRDLRGEFKSQGETFEASANEVVVVDPNVDLLAPGNKTSNNVAVAKTLTVRGVGTKLLEAKANVTAENIRFESIAVDMKRLVDLTENQKLPPSTVLPLSLILGGHTLDNFKLTAQAEQEIGITFKRMYQKDYVRGASAGGEVTGGVFLIDNQPKVTIERCVSGQANALDVATYIELNAMALKAEKNELSEEEALRMLGLVFAAPKPMLESFSLVNLAGTDPEFPLSLGEFVYANPSNNPYTASLGFKNLVLPAALIPEFEQIALLGYKTLDLSANFGVSWPSKELLQTSLNLSVKDMGEASTVLDLATTPELFTAKALANWETALAANPPKLAGLVMDFDDKGLLGRSAAMAQMTAGLAPDAATAMLQTLLNAIFSEHMSPENAKKRIDTFMTFVNKPGKLSLKVAPAQPLSLEAVSGVSGDEDFIIFEAVPGPKTLKELMPGEK